jgi:hypothetical protein
MEVSGQITRAKDILSKDGSAFINELFRLQYGNN